MSKNYLKKLSISTLAISALAFGAWHNDASASFWDWFKVGGVSQQTAATTATTYKWVSNGSVSKSDSRPTGECYGHKKQVMTYTCNSSTIANKLKLYDGTNKGTAYGDTAGHAWPIYEGENTSIATEYTYDSAECSLTSHNTTGTVNEWECKSSDSTNSSSSAGANSSSSKSSSSSSSFSYSTHLKVVTDLASNVTSNSATLNGTINPKGENVSYM
ncbi:MAG: hypothetical protein HW401_684, partial [Parcubacteria group bacterium]|nr:hypothetical protein [Parcubacteria group bacterium]